MFTYYVIERRAARQLNTDMSEVEESRMLKIVLTHGQGHFWNADDVHFARTKHRIVGHMVGSVPRHPHQTAMSGLPLLLMPEEVTLMVEKGFAETVYYGEMLQYPPQALVEKFDEARRNCYEEQVDAAFELRKQEIEGMADKILKGKLQKLEKQSKSNPSLRSEENFGLTKDKVIELELNRIQKLPEHYQLIQIFTEHPMITDLQPSSIEWPFPESVPEKLRYAVFKDLWEKGHYITLGTKFGGDFLVYKGDPVLFHAAYIVKCVMDLGNVDNCDLMTLTRLANSAKKIVVLASIECDRIRYKSFQLVEGQ